MKIVLLLVILIVYCSPQVSPIWSQTIRIDTGDSILINSGIATTSWVTTWSTTYTNGVTFSNAPWVALCIILLYSQGSLNIKDGETNYQLRADSC